MNFKKYFSLFTVALLFAALFASCSDNDHKDKEIIENPLAEDFYILNRGNWGMNDASIAYFNAATQELTADIYKSANSGDGLGDSAQDMIIYGGYIYVTVDGSNRLGKLDMNANLIASLHTHYASGPTLPQP